MEKESVDAGATPEGTSIPPAEEDPGTGAEITNENSGEASDDEEILIDLSKAKQKIKGFFRREEEGSKKLKEALIEDEPEIPLDEPLDFAKLKSGAKKFLGSFSKRGEKEERTDETPFDFNQVTSWYKKNSRWLIPLLCILLVVSVSSYFRMMPSYLPATDDWAESSVHNFYRNQVASQINQQYPNLPEQNRNALIEKDFQGVLKENSGQIESDISQLSGQYKANFQDEKGDTYLLAIDPFLWWGEARNVINHGHLGDTIVDGKSTYSLRNGRVGTKSTVQLHPYFTAYLYKMIHIFNKDISLMRVVFLMPVFLIGLAMIPTFFIGRKIAGNVGGLFAGIFLALNGPLLSRTPGGFSDTDPYNVLFPLLIAWLFLEAFTAQKSKNSLLLGTLAGGFVGVFAGTWSGWSYPFLLMIAAALLALVMQIIIGLFRKKSITSFIRSNKFKRRMMLIATFFVSSGVFVSLAENLQQFTSTFSRYLHFVRFKEVGLKSIWPKVITTVAEFNTVPLANIVSQMGGNLLFYISLTGVILTVFTKRRDGRREFIYFTLMACWFTATAYAFTKGIRFSILMSPVFALGLGSAFGMVYYKATSWVSKSINLNVMISRLLVLIVLCLMLLTPFSTAERIGKSEVPSMNDAWFNALTKIKEDSPRGIITSWWDFGHWFATIAERHVTFDGADQGKRIHWVGKALLTPNEKEAVGILRMLNCVQEAAPEKLDEFTGDTYESVKILYEVFPLSDRKEAYNKYLELGLTEDQAKVMLTQTHCTDLITNYYITSEDMVGKAGVWGHFGSWDFRRAKMYQNTAKKTRSEAVDYLKKEFSVSEEEADRLHAEIQTTAGDQWIAGWPGYHSGIRGCSRQENMLSCSIPVPGQGGLPIEVNLDVHDVTLQGNPNLKPNSLVYATRDGVETKEFVGDLTGFSLVLVPSGDNYGIMVTSPQQAASMFTRTFFLDGHGLKCFSKFDDRRQVSGGRIATWKVDFGCGQENKIHLQAEEQVNAAHILISTANREDEDARQLAEQIKGEATIENFAQLAAAVSEDPGSKENGGNLGWFGKGQMVPEFEQAAFSLREGEISELVRSQFGYHIIFLKEKRTG